VEQEKKHYFSVDETYALVKKEWKEKREKIEEVLNYLTFYRSLK
jgi:hypothetical protein